MRERPGLRLYKNYAFERSHKLDWTKWITHCMLYALWYCIPPTDSLQQSSKISTKLLKWSIQHKIPFINIYQIIISNHFSKFVWIFFFSFLFVVFVAFERHVEHVLFIFLEFKSKRHWKREQRKHTQEM